MGCRTLFVILVVSAAAACGGSPSSPSPGAGSSNLAAEAAVISTMTTAMRQVAVVGPMTGDTLNTFTMPCTTSGSIVITVGGTLPREANMHRSSSRIEYRECRNQTVTINGDPYLETTGEHSFLTLGAPDSDSVSTIRMTGGLRFDNAGVQGRVQFNCTNTMTVRFVSGSPQVSSTSTGTITFEQPLGSVPVARPCGPTA